MIIYCTGVARIRTLRGTGRLEGKKLLTWVQRQSSEGSEQFLFIWLKLSLKGAHFCTFRQTGGVASLLPSFWNGMGGVRACCRCNTDIRYVWRYMKLVGRRNQVQKTENEIGLPRTWRTFRAGSGLRSVEKRNLVHILIGRDPWWHKLSNRVPQVYQKIAYATVQITFSLRLFF